MEDRAAPRRSMDPRLDDRRVARGRGDDRSATARRDLAPTRRAAPARDAARLTPLHWAAAGDGGSAAEVLLACGAGIDVRSADGSTPLREAARRQAWRSASVLLAHGADPQAMDHDDATRDTESETVH